MDTDNRPKIGELYRLPVYLRDSDGGSSDDGISEVTIYSGDEEGVRSFLELDSDGISFDNYTKNPVVMWSHDSHGETQSAGLPIARTLEITRTGDAFRAKFQWSADPFAQRVKAQWDAGFLRAASVGFMPLELDEPEGEDKFARVTKADLLEWSIVSIPADPKALRSAIPHAMELAQYIGELKARGWTPNLTHVSEIPMEPSPTKVWVMDTYTPGTEHIGEVTGVAITPFSVDPEALRKQNLEAIAANILTPDPAPEIDLTETKRLISQLVTVMDADQAS